MEAWQSLESPFLLLRESDIDTDQIIPARFLKQTHREGLGAALFYDWRYDAAGNPYPEQPLNAREGEGLKILVAGPNFGCGSSREHAVWALAAYGFRAILSPSMGDIFRSNASKNGLLALEIGPAFYAQLCAADPASKISIELEPQRVRLDTTAEYYFSIDGFAKSCLMRGLDQLAYILSFEAAIARYEREAAT